jgi:hypothetical protein
VNPLVHDDHLSKLLEDFSGVEGGGVPDIGGRVSARLKWIRENNFWSMLFQQITINQLREVYVRNNIETLPHCAGTIALLRQHAKNTHIYCTSTVMFDSLLFPEEPKAVGMTRWRHCVVIEDFATHQIRPVAYIRGGVILVRGLEFSTSGVVHNPNIIEQKRRKFDMEREGSAFNISVQALAGFETTKDLLEAFKNMSPATLPKLSVIAGVIPAITISSVIVITAERIINDIPYGVFGGSEFVKVLSLLNQYMKYREEIGSSSSSSQQKDVFWNKIDETHNKTLLDTIIKPLYSRFDAGNWISNRLADVWFRTADYNEDSQILEGFYEEHDSPMYEKATDFVRKLKEDAKTSLLTLAAGAQYDGFSYCTQLTITVDKTLIALCTNFEKIPHGTYDFIQRYDPVLFNEIPPYFNTIFNMLRGIKKLKIIFDTTWCCDLFAKYLQAFFYPTSFSVRNKHKPHAPDDPERAFVAAFVNKERIPPQEVVPEHTPPPLPEDSTTQDVAMAEQSEEEEEEAEEEEKKKQYQAKKGSEEIIPQQRRRQLPDAVVVKVNPVLEELSIPSSSDGYIPYTLRKLSFNPVEGRGVGEFWKGTSQSHPSLTVIKIPFFRNSVFPVVEAFLRTKCPNIQEIEFHGLHFYFDYVPLGNRTPGMQTYGGLVASLPTVTHVSGEYCLALEVAQEMQVVSACQFKVAQLVELSIEFTNNGFASVLALHHAYNDSNERADLNVFAEKRLQFTNMKRLDMRVFAHFIENIDLFPSLKELSIYINDAVDMEEFIKARRPISTMDLTKLSVNIYQPAFLPGFFNAIINPGTSKKPGPMEHLSISVNYEPLTPSTLIESIAAAFENFVCPGVTTLSLSFPTSAYTAPQIDNLLKSFPNVVNLRVVNIALPEMPLSAPVNFSTPIYHSSRVLDILSITSLAHVHQNVPWNIVQYPRPRVLIIKIYNWSELPRHKINLMNMLRDLDAQIRAVDGDTTILKQVYVHCAVPNLLFPALNHMDLSFQVFVTNVSRKYAHATDKHIFNF